MLCLCEHLIRRHLGHNNPTATVQLNGHEHRRQIFARRILIMRDGRRVAANDTLKSIHQRLCRFFTRVLLAEIELADLCRIFRVHDDNARLVRNQQVACLIDREPREPLLKSCERDGSRHNACDRAVLHDRHSNDDNDLARDRRNHRLGDDGFARLHCLLVVIALPAVVRAIFIVITDAVRLEIEDIREHVRVFFDITQLRDTRCAITLQNHRLAGHFFQMRLVRFKDALRIQGHLLAQSCPNHFGILIQHIARHFVADAKENKKSYQDYRQDKR